MSDLCRIIRLSLWTAALRYRRRSKHITGDHLPILSSAVEVIKNPMAANIISVGAVNEIMQIASEASLEEAVLNHIPKGTEEKNIKALHLGAQLAKEALEEQAS